MISNPDTYKWKNSNFFYNSFFFQIRSSSSIEYEWKLLTKNSMIFGNKNCSLGSYEHKNDISKIVEIDSRQWPMYTLHTHEHPVYVLLNINLFDALSQKRAAPYCVLNIEPKIFSTRNRLRSFSSFFPNRTISSHTIRHRFQYNVLWNTLLNWCLFSPKQ